MKKKLFLVILFLLVLFVFYYFSPLINGIVMGIVFAYVAKPIKNRLRLGNLVSSAISTMTILLPISFLMFYGIFQGLNQLIYILTHQKELISSLIRVMKSANIPENYSNYIISSIPYFETYIRNYLKVSALDVTIKTVTFFMNFLISAIVCFYALCDGDRLVKAILSVLPEEYTEDLEKLLKEIDETLISLWFGNFAFAIFVGLLSIPYFMVFDVPYIPILSGLMFLAALIPIFAEWMVILPVAAFLATKSIILSAWFLLTGIILLYILPELFLRPHFLGYASKIHPLLILLSFIGGAMAGGAAGFFIAPTLVAVLTAVYTHYTGKNLAAKVKQKT